jgi:hypothetical protein
MKLFSIDITQLALIRIILRNVEPKLDSLYTFLTVAANYKGKVYLSQNIIAAELRMRHGTVSRMFNQLSTLNLLAKDYTTSHGQQQSPTLLPVNRSALMLHVSNLQSTGFEGMIQALKEQSKGFRDEYLDIDEIKRQVAVDKLQHASETVPRKAYTRKNNSAPMKYGYMFEHNGLSEYYAENNCSPEEVVGTNDNEKTGNSFEGLQQKETIERTKGKTISRAKRILNAQHTICKYKDIIVRVNKKEIELYSLLTNKSVTSLTIPVINSEIPLPLSSSAPLLPEVQPESAKVESAVTLVTLDPCQSNTGLQGATVKENTTLSFVKPLRTRQEALDARFLDFNANDAPETEKMAYCIYSYNRLVRVFPNLKQMQYPKALMEGRFENRSGAPAWMDHLCEFVSEDSWFEYWTAGLVRIATNSFLRDGLESWKVNFIWLFSEHFTIGSEDGDVEFFGINFYEKIISYTDFYPSWYRKYDHKDWIPSNMNAADLRLIDIDPWFKTNVEQFNCNYDYPVEGISG